jgi:hypothetical protein
MREGQNENMIKADMEPVAMDGEFLRTIGTAKRGGLGVLEA